MPKLILGGAKHQNNKQQPLNNKEARTTSTVSLFLILSLTLHILMSLLLTSNIFHILYDVKNAKIRAFYWKKERKLGLTDAHLSVFPPEYKKIKKISVNTKQNKFDLEDLFTIQFALQSFVPNDKQYLCSETDNYATSHCHI